jgi:hypothetical protein
VQVIDLASNELVEEVQTPVAPDGLALSGQTVWVATELGQQMVFTDGSLWLPILERGVVLRVTPPFSTVE